MKRREVKPIESDLKSQGIDGDNVQGGLKRGQDDAFVDSDSKYLDKTGQNPGVTPKASIRRAAKNKYIGGNGKLKN